MRNLLLSVIITSASLVSGCQTTKMEQILEKIGIIERPFNPDDVTITIIKLKNSLPNYVSNLKSLQRGQAAIRSLQIKLEKIDRQLRATRNPRLQKNLLTNFNQTLNQRVLIQDKASEVLDSIYNGITECKKKKVRIVNRIRTVLPRYASSPTLTDKLKEQKQVLENLDKYLSSLYQTMITTEKTLNAMFDYTLQYDNSHPRIYGQAFAIKNR